MFNPLKKLQQGAATLITSIALLALVTIAVLVAANVGILETRSTSNAYRAMQARFSAQAGIDYALSTISKYDLANPGSSSIPNYSNVDASTDAIAETAVSNTVGTSQTVGYYTLSIDKTSLDTLKITSIGQSQNKTATSKLVQKIEFAEAFAAPYDTSNNFLLAAPVIITGDADMDYTLVTKVASQSYNILIGGSIFKQLGTDFTTTTSNLLTLLQNLVVTDDTNLQTTDPHNLMFSMNLANFLQMAKQIDCSAGCSANSITTSMGGNQGQSKVNYTYGGNVTMNNVTIGSEAYPALVYINISGGKTFKLGDSNALANDTTIYGVLYVETGSSSGTWDNNNLKAKVVGSIIVNGNLSNGGYLTVAPTLNAYNDLSTVGVYTRLPGGWTDFN